MLHSLQTDTWTVLGLGGIVLTMLLIIKNLKAAKHHLPPSPPGDPIIGNLRHVPLEHSWTTFWSWKQALGGRFSEPLLF